MTVSEKVVPENFARFSSLPLGVEAELGRTTMLVSEILSLVPGSLIRLSPSIGSPLDLYVGGVRFSSAEVVSAGKSRAVRVVLDQDRKDAGKK